MIIKLLSASAVTVLLAGLVSTVSASAAEKASISTDKFDVLVINNYKDAGFQYDKDSKAKKPIFVANPIAPPGYYALGAVASSEDVFGFCTSTTCKAAGTSKTAPFTIVLKPKKGFENYLTRAESFTKVWNDAGSGSKNKPSFFVAKCPDGYSALGGIVVYAETVDASNDKQTGRFQCVKDNVLADAAWKQIWKDAGTGSNHDGAFWKAKVNAEPRAGKLVIVPNSFTPTEGYTAPTDEAKALRLTFDKTSDNILAKLGSVKRAKINKILPVSLSEKYETEVALLGNSPEVVQQTYSVPSVSVNDDGMNVLERWASSATYEVQRDVTWKLVDSYDATGESCTNWDNSDTMGYEFTEGLSHETNWNNQFNGSINVAGSGAIKPLGVGVELTVAVEFGYSHDFGGNVGRNEEKSKSRDVNIIPGTYGAVFEEQSEYTVFRTIAGNQVEVANSGSHKKRSVYRHKFKVVRYKPKGWTKDNPCLTPEASAAPAVEAKASVEQHTTLEGTRYDGFMEGEASYDEYEDANKSQGDASGNFHLLDAGHKLVKGKKHYSKSKNHYLTFESSGDLVVYTKGGDWVWGMREHIGGKGHVEKVVYQHDGNLAAYGANDAYMWSALHVASPKGTALHLTDDGVLQIVHPDKTVAWSSAK